MCIWNKALLRVPFHVLYIGHDATINTGCTFKVISYGARAGIWTRVRQVQGNCSAIWAFIHWQFISFVLSFFFLSLCYHLHIFSFFLIKHLLRIALSCLLNQLRFPTCSVFQPVNVSHLYVNCSKIWRFLGYRPQFLGYICQINAHAYVRIHSMVEIHNR